MPSSHVASFLEYARSAREEVDRALDATTQFDEDCPEVLREAIRYCLLAPGKRLRPILVLMAAQACGCPREQGLPAACAVEMVHTYSLVHDDLPAMDNDLLRRGLPTCHVRYGEATAILVGDALLARAFEILATGVQPPEIAARCCRELAAAAGASALVGGQVDDLAGLGPQAGVADIERIHRRKTGAMFRVSLRLGAILADADAIRLDALDAYGQKVGLAFQIIDDLLDIKGSTSALGKTAGKDSAAGKLTFPALLGEAASRRRAAELIADARRQLTNFGEGGAPLDGLAEYILERDR